MIKNIDHINVVVSDLEKARDFFLLLGFRVDRTKLLEGEWIEKIAGLDNVKAEYVAMSLRGQGPRIELLHYITPVGGSDPGVSLPNQKGLRHLAFLVEDIEKAFTGLKEKGIKFQSPIQTNPYGKKLCYFFGPDNIILELAEY